jgi:hypothetical protein
MNLARYVQPLKDIDTMYVFDDFTGDQSDITAVDTVTDIGTVSVGDGANGVAALVPSDGTVADNDEAYLATPNELYRFAANREIYGRFRVQFTEANADDANVAVGFMNAVGANALIDDGGGPKVSGSTLAIYKVDGSNVWKCASACNGVSTVSTSTKAAGGAAYQELEIVCKDWDGVNMRVLFRVDGDYLRDANNNVITHAVAVANSTEMQMFAGVKNGGANLETLNLDYWFGSQTRA